MDIDRLEIPLTNGVAPEVPNPPAPPHVPLFPTINTSVHPRQIAPRQIASHPQMMSVADHLVALQWEKEMKAQIICTSSPPNPPTTLTSPRSPRPRSIRRQLLPNRNLRRCFLSRAHIALIARIAPTQRLRVPRAPHRLRQPQREQHMGARAVHAARTRYWTRDVRVDAHAARQAWGDFS
ncbi:hypothetical protein P153DRAFT_364940 [Dothidotthia symphoricarpi CBS 119687]|uniref:Uncharacterized protein n=1 Tax=Dothidotthia symphoricarpi CBS 119687 TaxID=1392245 RepID=A0A6A6AIF6_9PLEO|nr:uncharacterized protein P153DRAFT_364940 [Dothidotthia symphoricarpi CBS 119687]KAF2131346.1 hypothetical protein P153DRAFT_364940 [Dothidotthia symphoricarpi CBS 119687]